MENLNSHITEQLVKKWAPVLDHPSLKPISDPYRKSVTATLLENQEVAAQHEGMIFETASYPNVAGNSLTGGLGNTMGDNAGQTMSNFQPILISLIRRAVPQLIAYDICGVQAMTMPTGLIFAMRSGYANTSSSFTKEALFYEANAAWSGTGTFDPLTSSGPNAFDKFSAALGVATAYGETDDNWPQMGFAIEKTSVEVKTRRLKADYTMELAQDLKAVHNLDAEAELANILSLEILNEINREVVRTVYTIAKPGGTANTTYTDGAGVVDLTRGTSGDMDGRYFAEQWRGLQFLMERDAIRIAKDTRRGKGNFVIVDPETASALASIGILDYSIVNSSASLSAVPDETSSTFAGVLGGRLKVYIDPFVALGHNFYCMGYKGASPYDAGLFYCPYVPLQMVRAQDPKTFQPSIGFKTRYGMKEHPFAGSDFAAGKSGTTHSNKYYRLAVINKLV